MSASVELVAELEALREALERLNATPESAWQPLLTRAETLFEQARWHSLALGLLIHDRLDESLPLRHPVTEPLHAALAHLSAQLWERFCEEIEGRDDKRALEEQIEALSRGLTPPPEATGSGSLVALFWGEWLEQRYLERQRAPQAEVGKAQRLLSLQPPNPSINAFPGGVVLNAQERLFTAHPDGSIRAQQLPHGTPLWSSRERHAAGARDLLLTADGCELISGGEEGSLHCWDAASGALTRSLLVHQGYITQLALSADGQRLATLSSDRSIGYWEWPSGRAQQRIPFAHFWVNAIALSAQGELIAACDDGLLRRWQAEQARPLTDLPSHIGEITALALAPEGSSKESPKGRVLACGSREGEVVLMDLSADGRIHELKGADEAFRMMGDSAITALKFSPQGTHLVASYTTESWVWEVASGVPILRLEHPLESFANHFAWSIDGDRLVSSHPSERIILWLLQQR